MSNIVGLLPAAGKATRLGAIPASKEILPLGFELGASGEWRPKTTLEAHLQSFKQAGASRACITISSYKHDIPAYIGNGDRVGLPIAYLVQERLIGMPSALDLAYPWVKDATTLFAMPDTLIVPPEYMSQLLNVHNNNTWAITLGLFKTDKPHKFGMVGFDQSGLANYFVDKPEKTELTYMWGCAVWDPPFAAHLHKEVDSHRNNSSEFVLSNVFESAIDCGLQIGTHLFDYGLYHDIGTPASFQAAVLDQAIQQSDDY